jgi:uncharacterized membrane protein
MSGGQGSLQDAVRPVSWVLFGIGLLVTLVMTATLLQELLILLLAGVFPALVGYAGLVWTGALPWAGSGAAETEDEEALVEELKRRYARGELSDAEMERKVETLLNADDDDPLTATTSREREREYEF